MNKDILFIIIVFVLIILGVYFVFFSGGLSNNPAFNTLNAIKTETGIGFSAIFEKSFTYKYESGDNVDIAGMGFSAYSISTEESDKIRSYFEDNGFAIDYFEMGSDMAGISYYSKEKTACVFRLLVLLNEGETAGKLNTDISCGVLAK